MASSTNPYVIRRYKFHVVCQGLIGFRKASGVRIPSSEGCPRCAGVGVGHCYTRGTSFYDFPSSEGCPAVRGWGGSLLSFTPSL